jgi:Mn2+/Fe2+ NRAMP family transporter
VPGLALKPLDAKAFYGAIAAATLIGVLINFVHLDPIKALFWSAVINGVVAVPLMVVIMLMATQRQVMGALHPAAAALGNGLAIHRRNGRCRRRDVCDLVIFHRALS